MINNYFNKLSELIRKVLFCFLVGFIMVIPIVASADTQWTLGLNNNIYKTGTGNVGIGSTAPPSPLTVVGGTNGSGAQVITTFRHKGTKDLDAVRLSFDVTSVDTQTPMAEIDAIRYGSGGSGDLAFRTRASSATSEKMRILSGGNVGIGTAAPLGKLHINGSYTTTVNTSGSDIGLGIGGSGNPIFGFRVGASPYNLYLNSYPTNTVAFNVMTWDRTNGNVGIGKTAPTQALDIKGNLKLSGNIISDGDICIGVCQ